MLTTITHPSPPREGLPHSSSHWSSLSGPLQKASPPPPPTKSLQSSITPSQVLHHRSLCPSTDLLIHHLGAPCPPVPAQKFPGGQQESLGVWRVGGPRLSHQVSVGAPCQGSDPRPLRGPGVPCGFRQGTSLSEPPFQDWSRMSQGVPRQPGGAASLVPQTISRECSPPGTREQIHVSPVHPSVH